MMKWNRAALLLQVGASCAPADGADLDSNHLLLFTKCTRAKTYVQLFIVLLYWQNKNNSLTHILQKCTYRSKSFYCIFQYYYIILLANEFNLKIKPENNCHWDLKCLNCFNWKETIKKWKPPKNKNMQGWPVSSVG